MPSTAAGAPPPPLTVSPPAALSAAAPHIGTLREKPLHAALKRWYATSGDGIETVVDGYVIDLVRDDLLIEVQTRGFAMMRRKVEALLEKGHRVRIVHPVARERWIVRVDGEGTTLGRRRSPRHGQAGDVVGELVSIAHLLVHPRLEVEVLLTHEEELRRQQPGGSWRRRGWAIVERRLLRVVESHPIRDPGDLANLLPPELSDGFTTADLAAQLHRPRRMAQQMAYCLRVAGVLEPVGRVGQGIQYRRAPRARAPRTAPGS